jgi:hypothetical protein
MLYFDVHRAPDAAETAWLARAAAGELAAIHAQGRAHGAVDADHLAFDGDALCLIPGPEDAGASPADDVRALGRLMEELLAAGPRPGVAPPSSPTGLWRRLAHRFHRLRPGRARLLDRPGPAQALSELARLACAPEGTEPPTAAALAALIAVRVPASRPPGRQPPPPVPPPWRAAAALSGAARLKAAWHRALAVVPLVALLATAAWLAVSLRHRSARPLDEPAPAPPRPEQAEGVLAAAGSRYSIGEPGDVVMAGDWLCRGSPLPALLRPATGEVFLFDRWAGPGDDVPGRQVGQVPGATGLAPADGPDGRCPTLTAVTLDGPPVPVPTAVGRVGTP